MRTGHWFATFTGTQFFLIDPHPDDVNIEDIAHALSNICRFGGHTREFYSVGQHVTHTSEILSEWRPEDFLLQLKGLLHDATESYLGDVVRPLKITMPDYLKYERRMEEVIYSALGVPLPTDLEHEVIKDADDAMLMAERRDLIKHRGLTWTVRAEPWDKTITPWSPTGAKTRFLARYEFLRRKVASTQ